MRTYSAIVLGAGGVGKSSLTLRLVEGAFFDGYDPTIEEVYSKPLKVDGELCLLQITDTAGAEQFTAVNEYYLKSARGFILVFSLTQAASVREVENLRTQIYRVKGHGAAQIPMVLVGTKADLASDREVSRETMQALADKWNIPYYETSAKRNWGVSNVFEDIVRQMKAKGMDTPSTRSKSRGHRKATGGHDVTKCADSTVTGVHDERAKKDLELASLFTTTHHLPQGFPHSKD
ncbi:hypothetical protein OPQ81_001530 [Rhizoctonia solani]|nr:hypothetical protein OPQ81_001530 [Rhizoctonia solani]